ncbi:MAG: UDP-N-acetylmuramoyl-tripeptide--D-alanyl-D-alanine ligase [Cyclobacteriaceae bacterium]|nr:UDP-N-acetylmuramoyl-tripeptide--D-alanyl-D-alanine ligase [Cyclobacteriaceae bacterium]
MDIQKLHNIFLNAGGISIDTRSISRNDLFFALKGPNFNANEYAKKAIDNGALAVVVDEEKYANTDQHILVEDTLDALQQLAKYHRQLFSIPVIGLTGSNGKTTTKELMAEVLGTCYNVTYTLGNLNNHIGVPLTLLRLSKNTNICIVEMGANHVGEIAALCDIAKPTHGLITNIGKAHVGTFGGFDKIIQAKSELYDFLADNNGVVWVNDDDEILKEKAKAFENPLLYPNKGGFYPAELISADPFLRFSDTEGVLVNTHLIGGYNFTNACAALATGKFFGVKPDQARKALSEYQPKNNRSQLIEKGDNRIILDAYNANPSSMEMALHNLSKMNAEGKQKIAIIGDMLELGSDERAEHEKTGQMIKELGLSAIYCGERMKYAKEQDPGNQWFADTGELIAALKDQPIEKSLMLIKGSRGMKMETILSAIQH